MGSSSSPFWQTTNRCNQSWFLFWWFTCCSALLMILFAHNQPVYSCLDFLNCLKIDFESSLKFRTRFHRLCPRRGAGGDVAVALIIYEPCSSHNHGTSLKLIIQININKNINIHNYGANLILIININKTSMYTCSSHNHGTSLNLIINININFNINININKTSISISLYA